MRKTSSSVSFSAEVASSVTSGKTMGAMEASSVPVLGVSWAVTKQVAAYMPMLQLRVNLVNFSGVVVFMRCDLICEPSNLVNDSFRLTNRIAEIS